MSISFFSVGVTAFVCALVVFLLAIAHRVFLTRDKICIIDNSSSIDLRRCSKSALYYNTKITKYCCSQAWEEDRYSFLKTGDVLLTSHASKYGVLIRIYGGTVWTHASFVHRFEKTGRVEIVELAMYSYFDKKTNSLVVKKGMLRLPLAEWVRLNKYRNDYDDGRNQNLIVAIARLKNDKGVIIDDCAFEHIIAKEKNAKCNLNMLDWITASAGPNSVFVVDALVKHRRRIRDRRIYSCSEFVVHLLTQLRLISIEFDAMTFRPCDFRGSVLHEFHDKYNIVVL
jgi:hypothetical protein